MLADEKRWDSRQREIVCNLLLCVYERARMCSHAHALYDRMKAQGYAPVLVTYNALLGLCEYERKWKTALSIFETMRARNVNPDAVTYNALISTLEECGEWEQATAWLETALERGMIHCFTSEDTTCELDLHHTRSAGTAQVRVSLSPKPTFVHSASPSYGSIHSAAPSVAPRALLHPQRLRSAGPQLRRRRTRRVTHFPVAPSAGHPAVLPAQPAHHRAGGQEEAAHGAQGYHGLGATLRGHGLLARQGAHALTAQGAQLAVPGE